VHWCGQLGDGAPGESLYNIHMNPNGEAKFGEQLAPSLKRMAWAQL
jgi:hypothetical protein